MAASGLYPSPSPSIASTGQAGPFPGQLAIDWTPAGRELARHVRRRESKAAQILERLRIGPANTLELARIGGIRFGARILELRAEGHRIATENHLDYAIYRLEEP